MSDQPTHNLGFFVQATANDTYDDTEVGANIVTDNADTSPPPTFQVPSQAVQKLRVRPSLTTEARQSIRVLDTAH